MSSRNHAVIDNGISTTVLPRNWLTVDGCSYSNWSMSECIFRRVMVRPFLQNTLLSSKSPIGSNYFSKCNTKCNPLREIQYLFFSISISFLETVPIFFIISHILTSFSILHLYGCNAGRTNHTFQCNPIQNHTIYSPWGNSISKALTLSNIYKHWADATLFLSPSFPLSVSLSGF